MIWRKVISIVGFIMMIAPRVMAAEASYIGTMGIYKAKKTDTIAQLAIDNDLGYVELRAANPKVDPWVPKQGTDIVLPKRHLLPDAPHKGIVINLPEMRIYAFMGAQPVTFPIGIGREGLKTPIGTTFVRAKMKNPTWRPTPRMRTEHPDLPEFVPPGPENPLGTHILYLNWPEYGMHGTSKPFGVGRRVSSGCIRLYPFDIPRLYDITPVGTSVTTVDQPIKSAWINDVFYVEAHTNMTQSMEMEKKGYVDNPQLSPEDWRRLMAKIGARANEIDWAALRSALRELRGYPVAVSKQTKVP